MRVQVKATWPRKRKCVSKSRRHGHGKENTCPSQVNMDTKKKTTIDLNRKIIEVLEVTLDLDDSLLETSRTVVPKI